MFETGEVSWKRSKDGIGLDTAQLIKDHRSWLGAYQLTKPGSRRFWCSSRERCRNRHQPISHINPQRTSTTTVRVPLFVLWKESSCSKGLALTPPVIGRISVGRVVEKNGKRLPEKDDEFTITSQVQLKDGWVLHPVDEVLRKDTNAKLRSIPVRLLFGDPDLSLRVKYTLFGENYRAAFVCG